MSDSGIDAQPRMVPAAGSYGAASNYMMRRRWDYFVKWLLGVDPPQEWMLQ